MDHPHEPMGAIKEWQTWYKEHRVVAEMDEPLVTKDSREKLHDTSKATDVLPDWRTFYQELAADTKEGAPVLDENLYKQKDIERATNYFADTIVEFFNDLTAQELYDCFVEAAKQNFKHTQKEYDNAKDLIDIIEKKTNGYRNY